MSYSIPVRVVADIQRNIGTGVRCEKLGAPSAGKVRVRFWVGLLGEKKNEFQPVT